MDEKTTNFLDKECQVTCICCLFFNLFWSFCKILNVVTLCEACFQRRKCCYKYNSLKCSRTFLNLQGSFRTCKKFPQNPFRLQKRLLKAYPMLSHTSINRREDTPHAQHDKFLGNPKCCLIFILIQVQYSFFSFIPCLLPCFKLHIKKLLEQSCSLCVQYSVSMANEVNYPSFALSHHSRLLKSNYSINTKRKSLEAIPSNWSVIQTFNIAMIMRLENIKEHHYSLLLIDQAYDINKPIWM